MEAAQHLDTSSPPANFVENFQGKQMSGNDACQSKSRIMPKNVLSEPQLEEIFLLTRKHKGQAELRNEMSCITFEQGSTGE